MNAQAGDGSGTSSITASNNNAWNQQASKSWSSGNNSMRQISSMSTSVLDCTMNGSNFANSDGEAGRIWSRYRVEFSASEPMDVYFDGGYGGTIFSGGATFRLYNRNTNATVFGGPGNSFAHIPAGQYAYVQEIDTFSRGQLDSNATVTFRPGNDTCQYAKPVSNGSYTGSTFAASGSADGVAACNSPAFSPAVWFSYTAPMTGNIKITTCGSTFDTVLAVFNNSTCGNNINNMILCNDDAPSGMTCGNQVNQESAMMLPVTSGTTHLIRLGGYDGAVGNYRLNVGPVNDRCDNMIPAVIGANAFDNTMADTDGAVLNSCVVNNQNQVGGDLWWSFIAPSNGQLTLDTCGSSFDTKLAIYSSYSCGASNFLACSDDACGLQSRIQNVQVNAGQYYTIRVGGYGTARGTGNLNLAFTPACPAGFNQDSVVDFFDYLDFVAAFSSNSPGADFNADTVTDFFDYLDFVAAFSSGC
ncbi:MAG: hypothetical protein KGS45_08010 [Planctomycetes bacterium]|nr:hypothetical protein [Planctomycetota bacterium]